MYITCLDLEGVLVPEIWIAFAEESGIPELRRTTRDEPDYDKLMRWRLGILKEHGLGLRERIVEAGVGVRQVRHLVTGDGEARGHELRGEVVLAAVAAEDGKILDQIHPFFPLYPMREEREWGLFVRRRARNGRSRASVDLSGICFTNATSPDSGEASRCGGVVGR